jgi:hypothetical protein
MSFIRNGEDRIFLEGRSNVYVYVSGGAYDYGTEPSPELKREGGNISGQLSNMTEADLAEISLRLIARADIDDDTLDEVAEAVTEKYPRTFERGATPPLMSDTLDSNEDSFTDKQSAIKLLQKKGFNDVSETELEVAYQLWQERG